MSKDSSGNCYLKSKKRLPKKASEMYQDLSEEEKTKNGNMVANDIKHSQKVKKKS